MHESAYLKSKLKRVVKFSHHFGPMHGITERTIDNVEEFIEQNYLTRHTFLAVFGFELYILGLAIGFVIFK